jgi:tRNA U34 5-methylaminomethyl-2-thiouridine-forming methyltransferase MnmC
MLSGYHNRNYGVLQYSKKCMMHSNNGVLVTYAARGVVKRSMIEVGFKVEKLAGPRGKEKCFVQEK